VQDHEEAGLPGEVEDAIQGRIEQARRLAAIFDDTNSLWMVNSPMPVNTPGTSAARA